MLRVLSKTHSITRSASGALGGSGKPASAAFLASLASKFLIASLMDVICDLKLTQRDRVQ
jgi:hypothetical protein